MSIADKNELLFQYGVNLTNYRIGSKIVAIGVYWKDIQKGRL